MVHVRLGFLQMWNHFRTWFARGGPMRVEEKLNETSEPQASLDALHRDVYANNMAPYWVVDRSAAHDEDRQVIQGRKAVPSIRKYKRQIEPLLHRSAVDWKQISERRSLVLVNSGLAANGGRVDAVRNTGSTIRNEVMPPHRHSPNAIRLGLDWRAKFHRGRGREHRVRPRRSRAHAPRCLAQPRQPGR